MTRFLSTQTIQSLYCLSTKKFCKICIYTILQPQTKADKIVQYMLHTKHISILYLLRVCYAVFKKYNMHITNRNWKETNGSLFLYKYVYLQFYSFNKFILKYIFLESKYILIQHKNNNSKYKIVVKVPNRPSIRSKYQL